MEGSWRSGAAEFQASPAAQQQQAHPASSASRAKASMDGPRRHAQPDHGAAERHAGGADFLVPSVVKEYISAFFRHFRASDTFEMRAFYAREFRNVSQKYYPRSEWPSAAEIAPLVDGDELFLALYNELAFRHMFGVTSNPTLEQRLDAYNNYQVLFQRLSDEETLSTIPALPEEWLYDMLDEFVYQFQAFCQYRAKLKSKSAAEIEAMRQEEYEQMWDAPTVLYYLERLVKVSQVNEVLDAEREGKTIEGGSTTLRLLGLFSLIELCRTHCMLADYYHALRVLDHINLDAQHAMRLTKNSLAMALQRVNPCNVTLHYHLGFAYMAMRRYIDAINILSSVLLFTVRGRTDRGLSYQSDTVHKKHDQASALLAICVALSPGKRLDAQVNALLRDPSGQWADKLQRMQAADESVFEECFRFGCPKFVMASPPDFESGLIDVDANNTDAYELQKSVFLSEVTQQLQLPTLRSYLKLYSTISMDKLANFRKVDESTFRSNLLCLKHKSRSMTRAPGQTAIEGALQSALDVHLFVENDMVHVDANEAEESFATHFMYHIQRFDDVTRDIERLQD